MVANGDARRHALSFRRVPARGRFAGDDPARYRPRVRLISVISDGTPKRFGGPQ